MQTYSHIVTATLFLGATVASWAQKSRSPFDPPASNIPPPSSTDVPIPPKPVLAKEFSSEIEMRGYFKLGEDYFFSIHQKKIDPKAKTKKTEWLKMGDTDYGRLGFRALRFDSKNEVLVMERGGMTEEISLHVSQWGKKPAGRKSSSRRGPFPAPRSPSGKRIMPPKPQNTPVLPTALQSTPPSNPIPSVSKPSPGRPETSSRNPSSSVSSGVVPGPFLPGRVTTKPSTTPIVPSSGSKVNPGVSSETRGSENTGISSSAPTFPSDTIKNISTGGTNATGEIDLLNLPPPPPPPNILPPGPPPDIEPSLGDR